MIAAGTPEPAKQPDQKPEKPQADKTAAPRVAAVTPESLVFPEVTEISTAAVALISFAGALLLAFGALFAWRFSLSGELQDVQARVTAARTELTKPDIAKLDEQAAEVTAGLDLLSSTLAVKPTASPFFKKLQSITHKDVRVSNLALGENGVVKFDGEAKTYQAVAKQISVFKEDPAFSDVLLVSAAQTQSGATLIITFSMQAKLVPAKLTGTK